MTHRGGGVWVVAAFVGGSALTGFAHRVPVVAPTHTVWDSVYTTAQASHGDSLYRATCIKCHGATLSGGDEGSPLVGSAFLGNWRDLTLDQLFDKIRTSMPPDNPKSIATRDVADLVAYLLAQNQFPAGAKVLTDSLEQLKDIKITTVRP
ncbi:MAG TPA: cytochrome c [Gemmatimonadaceae bacterium]|jgi:mono/diheme cytochrome c family protein